MPTPFLFRIAIFMLAVGTLSASGQQLDLSNMGGSSYITGSSFSKTGNYFLANNGRSPSNDTTLLFGDALTAAWKPFRIGEQVKLFLRFTGCPQSSNDAAKCKRFTSAFAPMVDDYTMIFMPNTGYPFIKCGGLDQCEEGGDRNVSATLYYNGQLLSLPWRKVSAPSNNKGDGSGYRYMQSRTILVTLSNGYISSYGWAPSSCVAAINCLCVENTCFYPPTTTNVTEGNSLIPNDLTLYFAWTGTDANGNTLTSYNRDIDRFTNAFAG